MEEWRQEGGQGKRITPLHQPPLPAAPTLFNQFADLIANRKEYRGR